MALGFTRPTGGGDDFLPILKYNSISGDLAVSSSSKVGDAWEKNEKDIPLPAKLIFDLAEIEIGYMHFSTSGPTFHLVKIGQPFPPLPADHDPKTKKYNQGFRVHVFSKEFGLCAFSQSSKMVGEAMDVLHNQYMKEKDANAGKLPVVEFKGTKKISVSTKEGAKTYKCPEWSIVSWVDRPEAMSPKVVEEVKASASVADDDF